MNSLKSIINKSPTLVFLVLLLGFYYYVQFYTILFYRPQGIHFTRQTDSLSFAANYLLNGFDFFNPQVFNLASTEGRAASEFPIIYFIAALITSVCGNIELNLRFINLIVASVGFVYLFKLLQVLIENIVYSYIFTFMFISSTVLLYYANNFIPDVPAFSFTIIGWYYFILYLKHKHQNYVLISQLFFCIASLIKVVCFISPIAAILAILTFEIKFSEIKKGISKTLPSLLYFSISLILVLGWNIFVIRYNQMHQALLFLTTAKPIWNLTKPQMIDVWNHVSVYWYHSYWYHRTFQFYFIIIVAGAICFKSADKKIRIITCFMFLGSLSYFFLFFAQFKSHDYYFISLMPTIFFIIISNFISIKNKFKLKFENYFTKVLCAILCLVSIKFAKARLIERYDNHSVDDIKRSQLANIKSYIDSLGISQNAKFVVVGDDTPNGTLYFINRKGWIFDNSSIETFNTITKIIGYDADYILYTEKKYILTGLKSNKVGEKTGILIYKLIKE